MKMQHRAGDFSDDLVGNKILPTPEKNFVLSSPLGNSLASSIRAPAWQINSLIGEFGNVIHYTTGSQPTTRSPQIDVTIEYDVGIERGEPKSRYEYRGASDAAFFEDGTQLRVWEDRIILDVVENNAPFSLENYDIEVFLVEEEDVSGNISTPGITNSKKREILVPLNFVPKHKEIQNEILLPPGALSQKEPIIDPSYVEYFLELEADFEIDQELLAMAKSKDKKKSIFTDKRYGTAAQRQMIRDLYSDGFPLGAGGTDRPPGQYEDSINDAGIPLTGEDMSTGPGGHGGAIRDFDSGGPVTAVDDEVC
jgi:hypothetical protein